jgi:type VI secretion system protein ImpH
VKDLAEYESFLPTGKQCQRLADAVFFFIGDQLDWEVELALPSWAAEPAKLGRAGRLGWTGWMSPNWTDADQTERCDARFRPATRRRVKEKAAA